MIWLGNTQRTEARIGAREGLPERVPEREGKQTIRLIVKGGEATAGGDRRIALAARVGKKRRDDRRRALGTDRTNRAERAVTQGMESVLHQPCKRSSLNDQPPSPVLIMVDHAQRCYRRVPGPVRLEKNFKSSCSRFS
ncbi:hypothetical protein R1sor_022681 [Riccia sorocarpa]|uniref:Ribosomal protein S14 n=1 Tax=Riccia sorocarpa TaxID=122646 RepID=A0ABD3GKI3_9MARC